MPRKLLTQFRLNPEAQCPDYYVIRIAPTRAAMYAEYQRVKGIDNPVADQCDFLAITCPIEWDRIRIDTHGRETHLPKCGTILFHGQAIDAEIVSHEMTHAAIDFLERDTSVDWSRLKDDMDLEERLCGVQGRLTAEFWGKWQAWQRRQTRKAEACSLARGLSPCYDEGDLCDGGASDA